ncbi:MAG: hypothetical protein LBT32_03255 [Peptococcaceae bacterium]|jgi:ATP-binding cassette subfamily B protein|nr:hypothetical protein [Peptococcaceae bacterium]
MSEHKPQMGPSIGKGAIILQKPKNTWLTIKRLLGYMKKSSLLLVLSLIAAIAGTIHFN